MCLARTYLVTGLRGNLARGTLGPITPAHIWVVIRGFTVQRCPISRGLAEYTHACYFYNNYCLLLNVGHFVVVLTIAAYCYTCEYCRQNRHTWRHQAAELLFCGSNGVWKMIGVSWNPTGYVTGLLSSLQMRYAILFVFYMWI